MRVIHYIAATGDEYDRDYMVLGGQDIVDAIGEENSRYLVRQWVAVGCTCDPVGIRGWSTVHDGRDAQIISVVHDESCPCVGAGYERQRISTEPRP